MLKGKQSRASAAAIAILLVSLMCSSSFIAAAKTKPKKKEIPQGDAVLWQAPTDIRSRNLFLGAGGAQMKPDLRHIKFIKDEKGGYSKKFRIRDAAGREWVAKVGKEAQSETAAVRLLWAVGYETEVNYLVPRLTIPGKGTFENVRLEARPDSEKRVAEWKWKQNPFVGTREFQGLKVMMLLLSNWDIKDSNNQIIAVKDRNQLRYVISDLGATFGKTGSLPLFWRFTRSRNKPTDYVKTAFVDDVDGNLVDFHYGGRQREIFKGITVEQAQWVGTLLSRLTPAQIRDAFRAANYTPAQQRLLTQGVLDRVGQLLRLPDLYDLEAGSSGANDRALRERNQR